MLKSSNCKIKYLPEKQKNLLIANVSTDTKLNTFNPFLVKVPIL